MQDQTLSSPTALNNRLSTLAYYVLLLLVPQLSRTISEFFCSPILDYGDRIWLTRTTLSSSGTWELITLLRVKVLYIAGVYTDPDDQIDPHEAHLVDGYICP